MDDLELPFIPSAPLIDGHLYSAAWVRKYVRGVLAAAIAADRAKGGDAVATVRVHKTGGNAGLVWSAVPVEDAPLLPDGTKLFTRPSPAPEMREGLSEAMRMIRAHTSAAMDNKLGWTDRTLQMDKARKRIDAALSTSPAPTQATQDAEQAAMYRHVRDVIGLPHSITQPDAFAFIAQHHRHHRPPWYGGVRGTFCSSVGADLWLLVGR